MRNTFDFKTMSEQNLKPLHNLTVTEGQNHPKCRKNAKNSFLCCFWEKSNFLELSIAQLSLRERSSIMSAHLRGGGLSQNAEIIHKIINIFLNHALISLNAA